MFTQIRHESKLWWRVNILKYYSYLYNRYILYYLVYLNTEYSIESNANNRVNLCCKKNHKTLSN